MSWGPTVPCPGSAPREVVAQEELGVPVSQSGLCPACRKAQSKALIKAAVRNRSVLGGKWRSLQSLVVCV